MSFKHVNTERKTGSTHGRANVALTTNAETTLVAGVTQGEFILDTLIIANLATSVATVELRDATAGSVMATFAVPASATFFINNYEFVGIVNSNMTVKATTATPNLVVSAQYYRAQ